MSYLTRWPDDDDDCLDDEVESFQEGDEVGILEIRRES